MSVSAARAATLAKGTFEGCSVIGFKDGQTCLEQFAFRDNDDVESGRQFVAAKNLSDQSFRSVPLHRAAKLSGGRDAQPSNRLHAFQREQRAIAAVDFRAFFVHPLELRTAPDPLRGADTGHCGAIARLFARDRETLAPLRAAAFQHETTVFRTHADEKAVRPFAMAGIRLECTLALHGVPSE